MKLDWRPSAAEEVPLGDDALAQLGMLAVLETQARSHMSMALKAVAGLGFAQWKRLDASQFEQITERLQTAAAGLDATLEDLIAQVQADQEVLVLRHEHVDRLWAIGPDGTSAGWDTRRDQRFATETLPDALQRVATFTFATKRVAIRVAELILDGVIAHPTHVGGPKMRWRDQLVSF